MLWFRNLPALELALSPPSSTPPLPLPPICLLLFKHFLQCPFSVPVQPEQQAADRGPGRPALPLVHAELPQALQPPQAPEAVPQPLHLQLRGEGPA